MWHYRDLQLAICICMVFLFHTWLLKSFASYSYFIHLSCSQRIYGCAFDEHLVFAHISKVNSVNLSWGTRHNVNSKPWRLSGALLATARAPECVLCLDFEDHQSHNNPWWSTVVGVIYHRWPMSSFYCELASQCKNH